MEGIQFLVDSEGNKKAVLIDLEKYGELLEDFFDLVISQHRLDTEATVPFDLVVKDIETDRATAAKEKEYAATV